jgi:PAS domain S-box-containing protein
MAGLYIFQSGHFSYVNPAFAEIFGLDREKILRELLPENLAHPDDRPKMREFLRRQLEGETSAVRFVYRGLRADGSIVRCEDFGKAVQLDGRPAIVGTVLDVTDRERAEQDLIESEALFRGVAEKSPNMVLILQDDRVVYANPASESILGYSRAELLSPGFDYTATCAQADQADLRARMARQLEGAEVGPFEFGILRKDGRRAEVLQTSRLINHRGRVAILLIVSDITLRKRAEAEREALLRAEQEQRLLAETLVRVGLSLSANLELRSLMDLICQQSLELFGVAGAYVWMVEGTDIVGFAGQGSARDFFLGLRLPISDPVTLGPRVIREGRPSYVNRAESSNLVNQPLIRDFGAKAILGMPLLVGGRAVGALILMENENPDRFSQRDVELAGVFGSQLAVAVANARLIEETHQRLRRETLLKEAIGVFASTLDVKSVLSRLAEKLCQAVEASSAYICEYDRQLKSAKVRAEYYTEHASPLERESDLGVIYDLTTQFPGRLAAIEAGQAQVRRVSDPVMEEVERGHMQRYGAKATLVIPVNVAGQVMAYATIWESRWERSFTPEEIELSQAIAQQAAVAIESGRLYERAQREIEDRQRAQEALRESEERYRAVAETAFTGIILLNTDYQMTFVNPAFAELLGYHPESLLGVGLAEIMDSEQFAKLREHDRSHAGGQRSQYGLVLRRRDDSTRQVLISAAPMHNARGEPVGSVMVVTDISDLKATEDALSVAMVRMEEGLQRTRDLVETEQALRDTTAAVSGTLNLDEVLERVLENVGRVVGHDTADIMLLLDTDDGKLELRAVRERGYAERGLKEWLMQLRVPWQEMENFRKMERTGKPIAVPDTRSFPGWVELPETRWIGSYAGAPLRRKGKTIGFLNLSSEQPGAYQQSHAERLQAFADQAAIAIENARLYAQARAEIEQRARTQAALRISEQRSRSVFDGVQDAILVASPSGQILEVNPAACELFGASLEGLLKQNVWDLVAADPATVMADGGQAEGSRRVPLETTGRRPDGSTFEAEITARLHGLGSEALVMVVVRDISERKAAETAERNFARMKQEFVLSASHSLRTPLHTLKGYLELLSSGKVREPEREVEFLANAIGNAERIEQIVHELLDITQMESETGRLRMESVAVNTLLGSTVEALAESAQPRGIRLVLEQAHPHLRVSGDGRRLAKAIREIVGNAIKFSPEGGVVTVQAMDEDGRVNIRVTDQGPGIPEAELVSLFSNSGDGGTSEVPSPGLGLYLAHAVIDAHRGEIRVDSETGRGTTFEIVIPSGS